MTIALVPGQVNSADAGSVTSATLSFPAGTTAGNAIVVGVRLGSAVAFSTVSVSDDKGNTYVRDVQVDDSVSGNQMEIFSAANVAGGTVVVTVTLTGGAVALRWGVCEYQGLVTSAPLDKTSTNNPNASNTSLNSNNTATTANANDLLVGVGMTRNNTVTFTAGTGYALRFQANKIALEDKSVSATGAYNATETISVADTWMMAVAAYKGAAGANTTFEQEGFRWRNDDGGETSATWLAAQDADVTQPSGTNTLLRVLIDSAADDPPPKQFQLEYKKSADANYAKVLTAQPATVMPTFVAKGTFTSGTAAITPGLPAGIQGGVPQSDLLLLFVETANQAMAAPAGWTQVTNSPQSTGTAAAAGGVRLTVFYKFAAASETAPTLADSGDHQTSIIMAFRGVDNTTPFNVTAGGVTTPASTAVSCPAATTTAANCLVVNAIALDADLASTTNLSAVANTNLSSVALQHTQTVIAGAGGGLAVVTGGKAAAGSTGSTTATDTTSEVRTYLTMALNPAPVSQVPILLATSSNIAAGGTTATTAQLTPPGAKTTAAFQAGLVSDDTNPLPSLDLALATYTELEWCLRATGPAADGDVYQFRVTVGGIDLTTYSVTPQWTIGTAGPPATAASPAAVLAHL
jgi:hypothetical protein